MKPIIKKTITVAGKKYHLKKGGYYKQGDHRDYQHVHGHILWVASEAREDGFCTQVVFTHFNPDGEGFGMSAVYVGPKRNSHPNRVKFYR